MKVKHLKEPLTHIFFGGKQRYFVNRKVKDRLFRFIFSKDKEALLQLYNALNGTEYTNTEDLEITYDFVKKSHTELFGFSSALTTLPQF